MTTTQDIQEALQPCRVCNKQPQVMKYPNPKPFIGMTGVASPQRPSVSIQCHRHDNVLVSVIAYGDTIEQAVVDGISSWNGVQSHAQEASPVDADSVLADFYRTSDLKGVTIGEDTVLRVFYRYLLRRGFRQEGGKGDVPAERGHDQTWGDRGGGQYWQSRCCNFTTIGNGGPYNTAEEAKAAARVGCLATQQPEHEGE